MKSKLAARLAINCFAIFLASSFGKPRDLPSKINLSSFGCSVQAIQYSPRPGAAARDSFELTVWAKHSGALDFEQVYSVRPKIRQAFGDCGKWAEKVWEEKRQK